MPDQRVSMFISHKVANHKRTATRIKEILESRTERLDVLICEEIPAGDRWREWIANCIVHSQILLVLLPDFATDLTWIADEIGRFQSACPTGRLVVLKSPFLREVPDIVRDRYIIEASKDQLQEHFLEPLYRCSTFTGLEVPLNRRVTDADLMRDAKEIEDALLGIVDPRSEFFGESLVVETAELDVTTAVGLGNARVRAPNGCSRILNWNRRSFSWNELRIRAAEEKGKGTFWVSEMEQVITEVAQQNRPQVMTSTFRGRGPVAGQIFRPQLECVDFVDDTPVRYHFFFHEVLVPELVRGPERIGDVFNLLHIATRIRWEVLNPFLVKLLGTREALPSRIDLSQEARHELIGRVLRSVRIIEQEAERHNMRDSGVSAFDGDDRELIVDLLAERERIYTAIAAAAQREDFDQFMGELMRALDLNCRVMDLLASRFLELVREDCGRVKLMMQRIRSKEAQLQ
jgi:hypothetical protein